MCPYLNLDTLSQLSSIVKQTNTKKKLDVFFIFTIITNYRLWFHNQLTIYVCRIMCIMKYIDSGLCIVTIQKSVLWLVWKFNFVALSIWLNHEDI